MPNEPCTCGSRSRKAFSSAWLRWPGLAEYDDEGQNYYLDQARAIFAREQAEEDEG